MKNSFLLLMTLLCSDALFGQFITLNIIDNLGSEYELPITFSVSDSNQVTIIQNQPLILNTPVKIKLPHTGKFYLLVYSDSSNDSIQHQIQLNNDTSMQLHAHFQCKYNRANPSVSCPKCNKKDKVLPIEYGLLIISNPKKHSRKKRLKFHPGGCEITGCDPIWYCERDQVSF